MAFIDRIKGALAGFRGTTPAAPGQKPDNSSESGSRRNADAALIEFQNRLWVDTRLLATIREIRRMDRIDGRVKKIHGRSARAAAKGGLRLIATGQPRLEREWKAFCGRLKLNEPQKLQSDIRGLMVDGNLALQWVLDDRERIVAAPRMPVETMKPNVGKAGVFENPAAAYDQFDLITGQKIATFALWQMTVGRLDPDNYDDWSSLGRPYLDASRSCWRKLDMTEEDAVLRRHMRAAQRMSHILEGASDDEVAAYKQQVEADQGSGAIRDYYSNKKGAVTAVQGDANLEQIADVVHMLDTFYSGSPLSKGLMGYTSGLNRDILEDLKKDWYDEMDAIQTVAASVYRQGFELHLLLRGIDPGNAEFDVGFTERMTDTPNQRADLALKVQALGASRETAFETAGLNAADEAKALEREREQFDPYPHDVDEPDPANPNPAPPPGRKPRVAVTPGNGRKGDSATTVSTRTKP